MCAGDVDVRPCKPAPITKSSTTSARSGPFVGIVEKVEFADEVGAVPADHETHPGEEERVGGKGERDVDGLGGGVGVEELLGGDCMADEEADGEGGVARGVA